MLFENVRVMCTYEAVAKCMESYKHVEPEAKRTRKKLAGKSSAAEPVLLSSLATVDMKITKRGISAHPNVCPVVECAFSRQIFSLLQTCIQNPNTPYIVGCVAYITNEKITHEFSQKLGACIVTMPGDGFESNMWTNVKPVNGHGPIKFMEHTRRENGHMPLMHHKFIIGLTGDLQPLWVATGSYNFTYMADNWNCENIVLIRDHPALLDQFYQEFVKMYANSVNLQETEHWKNKQSLSFTQHRQLP